MASYHKSGELKGGKGDERGFLSTGPPGNVFVYRYLQIFSQALFSGIHQSELMTRRAFLKGDLKEVLVSSPPIRNPRIDELIQGYHGDPGRFYRETPFNGRLFFRPVDNGYEYIGSSRIKRIRRLAERSARKGDCEVVERERHSGRYNAVNLIIRFTPPRE